MYKELIKVGHCLHVLGILFKLLVTENFSSSFGPVLTEHFYLFLEMITL